MNDLVYIAAPYRGNVAENVRRASTLSRYAVELGLVPLCPHGFRQADGDPDARERGIRAAVRLAEFVGRADGRLWAIANDGGDTSEGTYRALSAFIAVRQTLTADCVETRTWRAWAGIMDAPRSIAPEPIATPGPIDGTLLTRAGFTVHIPTSFVDVCRRIAAASPPQRR